MTHINFEILMLVLLLNAAREMIGSLALRKIFRVVHMRIVVIFF
jgi:hypothetical protein